MLYIKISLLINELLVHMSYNNATEKYIVMCTTSKQR